LSRLNLRKPGHAHYGVAIRNETGLWLHLRIHRNRKDEVFVIHPTTVIHADGARHRAKLIPFRYSSHVIRRRSLMLGHAGLHAAAPQARPQGSS